MIFSSILKFSIAALLLKECEAAGRGYPGDENSATLRGETRSVNMPQSITDPESRHDDPVVDSLGNNPLFIPQSPQTTTTAPPQQNGGVNRPTPVVESQSDIEALGRHDDDPLETELDDTRNVIPPRHADDPDDRDVSTSVNMTANPEGRDLIPSAEPSFAPSVTPSDGPSTTPTDSVAPSLSLVPTSAPSFNGTGNGTGGSPTGAPTSSLAPSTTPSLAPSVNCNANDAGFFGDTSNGANREVVRFNYELEYRRGANTDDMFAAVEKMVADTVVPFLFADVCSPVVVEPKPPLETNNTNTTNTTDTNTTGTNMTDTNMTNVNTTLGNMTNVTTSTTRGATRLLSRLLKVVGFSPQPVERFLSDVACRTAVASPINLCNVTDGRFTMFLDAPENGETITALAAIRASMDKGDFNDVHPSVVRISYVDDVNAESASPTPAPTVQPRNAPTTSGLPVWAYVLIALGVVLLIGLGVFVWRRRVSREKAIAVDQDDLEFGDEVEEAAGDDGYQPPGATTRLTPHEEDYEYDQSSSQGGSRKYT